MSKLFPDLDLSGLKFEDFNGEKHIEREYTAYARVEDFSWIDEAPEHEQHEQWEIPYSTNTTVRGRLRLINNRRYTEAVKEKLRGEEGSYEVEFDISRDAFEMKKKACVNGYSKDRYNFPIAGSNQKWEIDVFKSQSGGRSEWVKIDLEYDSKADAVPDFPFPVKEVIIVDQDSSVEAKEIVNSLWESEWLKLEHSSARGGIVK
mgnify:CR=1 FL=1